jgi:lipopolysaccharide export system protein LptA
MEDRTGSRNSEDKRRRGRYISGRTLDSDVFFILSVLSFILISGLWLLTPDIYAVEKDAKQEQVPTVITSESLTADNKAKTALFTGSVVAKKGEMALYADRMLVYYSESGSGGNIDRIEADGNCKLIRGDRVLTSGKIVYYAGAEERAVFTENPRGAEGKNVVTGTRMTYYMKDDRSVVENSKVFIVEKDQGARDRKPTDKSQDKKKK